MSKEDDNKAIIARWFTNFWGKTCNLDIVDELAAPDMLLPELVLSGTTAELLLDPTCPSSFPPRPC